MAGVFAVEMKKARRRFDAPLALAVAVVSLVWAAGTAPDTAQELASGYSALFYALPVINTIVMPVGMAMLASRLWDIETRGGMYLLLLTMQSRNGFFAGKAMKGVLLALMIALCEGVLVLLTGRMRGFTQALDVGQLAWLCACTFAVDAMLFFAWLALSVRFSSQAPTLAAGLVASLSGLFAAFFPEWLSLLMPWGWYVPLSGMAMGWERATRETWYYPHPMRVPLLAAAFALAIAFAMAACRMIDRGEGMA